MSSILSQSQQIKIVLIIFLMTISIPLIIFDGTIDHFAPKHITEVQEISCSGRLDEENNNVIQISGFYILGTTVALITGLTAEMLLYLPIQLLPCITLLYLILYKLSGNSLISMISTLIYLCSGTTGTAKLYFWPHGIGYILLFTIFIIVISIFSKSKGKLKCFVALSLIVSSSLVFISYNMNAMTIVLYGLILSISGVAAISKKTLFLSHLKCKDVASLLVVPIIVTFGLSAFVYSNFIPILDAASEFEMGALDKFIIAYIHSDTTELPLSAIMVTYPTVISIVSAIKYVTLGLAILTFFFVVIRKSTKKLSLNSFEIFLLIILAMHVVYSVPRIYIGHIAVVTILYIPGLFCITYLSQVSKYCRIWSFVMLFVVLLCTASYYCVLDYHGFIDSDEHQFDSYKYPVSWYLRSGGDYPAVSDEYTKNFFVLNLHTYHIDNITSLSTNRVTTQSIQREIMILPAEDALTLVQLYEEPLDKKYFIINNRLNSMSLKEWRIIKSWVYSKNWINCNHMVNKVYSAPLLDIYASF